MEFRAALRTLLVVVVVGLSFGWADRALGGEVYWVDASAAPDGDGSELYPFQTITAAGQRQDPTLLPGDVVIVKEGIYLGDTISLRSGVNGSEGQPIIFKPEQGAKVILDGQDTTTQAVSLDGHNYVRIEGFEIRRYTQEVIYLQEYSGTSGVGFEIVGNYIHHCGNHVNWTGGNRAVADPVPVIITPD